MVQTMVRSSATDLAYHRRIFRCPVAIVPRLEVLTPPYSRCAPKGWRGLAKLIFTAFTSQGEDCVELPISNRLFESAAHALVVREVPHYPSLYTPTPRTHENNKKSDRKFCARKLDFFGWRQYVVPR